MTDIVNKVFVYGTLLKGEVRSPHMSDCSLLGTFEVPGILYDTGRGYPAMVSDEKSLYRVLGELYLMIEPENKISELDVVEFVESGLFKREKLKHAGADFYVYEAGPKLSESLKPQNKITEGNWRRYSSLVFHDPVAFALNFEDRQKYHYRDPVSPESDGLIYIKGDIPLLVTAPHSSVHKRMGKLKRHEHYTAALALIIHSLTGCHVLYTNRLMESDPNYYEDSPFKNRIKSIADTEKIRLLIDLHGTGRERPHDLYPGVGNGKEFLLGQDSCLDMLYKAAQFSEVSVGGLDVFPAAKQMTVAKYGARKLRISSIQLEINHTLRDPEKRPDDFMRLAKFLRDFIDGLNYLSV